MAQQERSTKIPRTQTQPYHYIYTDRNGAPLIRVVKRYIKHGTDKKIWQEHWQGQHWVPGYGTVKTEEIPIYPYGQVLEAIASGNTIIHAEGEGVVDALWSQGIPAFCTIGGTAHTVSKTLEGIKPNPEGLVRLKPALADLGNAPIVLAPDRDLPGVLHMELTGKQLNVVGWLYAYADSPLWQNLPTKHGLDLCDWIKDFNPTSQEILRLAQDKPIHRLPETPPVNSPPPQQLTASEVDAQLHELIKQDAKPSTVTWELNQLEKCSAYRISELRRLYQEKVAETEVEENRHSNKQQLETLHSAKHTTLNLYKILPEPLAQGIYRLAGQLNLRAECYLIALLGGLSSLHHSDTRLILHQEWDFVVTPNLFCAIVSPSSQKKSPILKTMVQKPLQILQAQARQQHQQIKMQYQQRLEEYETLKYSHEDNAKQILTQQFPDGRPTEPRQKLYYFTHATGEGIAYQVQKYPDKPLLYLKDELAGIFKSFGEYKKGRGSEQEDLLSYYDGTGGTLLRAEGARADLDGLLLSLIGTIQPSILATLLKDFEDSNGNWARFMFVNQPLAASWMTTDGGQVLLSPMLAELYSTIDQLSVPATFKLNPKAFKRFTTAYNWLERQRIQEPRQAMRAVWGKCEGRIGKVALNLHKLWAAWNHQTPTEEIPLAIIDAAIDVTLFCARQVEALYGELEDPTALSSMLSKILEMSQLKSLLTAKDVQLSITAKHRPSSQQVRQWFKELAAMGLGETSGTGRSLKFSVTDAPHKSRQSRREVDETVDNSNPDSETDTANSRQSRRMFQMENSSITELNSDTENWENQSLVYPSTFESDSPSDNHFRSRHHRLPSSTLSTTDDNLASGTRTDLHPVAAERSPPEKLRLTLNAIVFDRWGNLHQMISATPSGFLTNQGANISIEDFRQGQYRFPTISRG
jgi:hypothetical protein